MSIYRKLTITLYRMPEFRRLPPIAKLVFIALMTCKGTVSVPGLFEGDHYALAGELAMATDEVEAALRQLEAAKLIEMDLDRGLIAVSYVAAYQDHGPANESVVKGWIKTLTNVVDCAVKPRHVRRVLALWPDALAPVKAQLEALAEPLPNPSQADPTDTVSPTVSNTVSPTMPAPCTPSVISEQQQQQHAAEALKAFAAGAAQDGLVSAQGVGVGSQKGKKPRSQDGSGVVDRVIARLKAGAGEYLLVPDHIGKKHSIAITKLTQRHGDDVLDLVSAYIGAGRHWVTDKHRRGQGDPLSLALLISIFDDDVSKARAWDAGGRQSGTCTGFAEPCEAQPASRKAAL